MSAGYGWCCARCDGEVAGPWPTRAEAAVLAAVHDGLWHGGAVTADVLLDAADPTVVAA